MAIWPDTERGNKSKSPKIYDMSSAIFRDSFRSHGPVSLNLFWVTTKVCVKWYAYSYWLTSTYWGYSCSLDQSEHTGYSKEICMWFWLCCGLQPRDLFGYGLSQWEMTLHCNVISHWLSPYPEWSRCQLKLAFSPNSRLLLSHQITTEPVKQFWKSIGYNHDKTKQNITKPLAYFMGYTVCDWIWIVPSHNLHGCN